MANLYTQRARANVALSVTLTALRRLAAMVTTPLALAALEHTSGEQALGRLPLSELAGELFLLLVVPVLLGTGMCRRWAGKARRLPTLLARRPAARDPRASRCGPATTLATPRLVLPPRRPDVWPSFDRGIVESTWRRRNRIA